MLGWEALWDIPLVVEESSTDEEEMVAADGGEVMTLPPVGLLWHDDP